MAELTPPVISRLPLGLLGFLGIKSGGKYPENLAGQIAPIWELQPHMAGVHGIEVFDVAVPITGLNFNPSTIVVPQTEVWYIAHCTGIIFVDATEAIQASIGFTGPQIGTHQFTNAGFSIPVGAVLQRRVTMDREPMYLPPGTILGFTVEQVTGAPFASNAHIRAFVVKLPI